MNRNRRYPDDIPQVEIDQALCEIERIFTITWLTDTTENHNLRKLWQRRDVLSTLELYSFGHALIVMNQVDARWVNGQIKQIMSKNENNRVGAFFEIILLSYLAQSSSYKLTPAPGSQPGFDATIQFADLSETMVSIKNYGRSKHDREFEKSSACTEKIILSSMKKFKLFFAQFIIMFKGTSSPNEEDWANLQMGIPSLISRFSRANKRKDGARIPMQFLIGNWEVRIWRGPRLYELHEELISYLLIITGSHHYNEARNLYDKLNAAQENFTKHVPANSASNIIIIHVPLTITVKQCQIWTQQYFDEHPEATAQMVIYYQCALVHSLDDENHLTHTFSPVINPHNFKASQMLHFIPPVGMVSTESSHYQIVMEGVEFSPFPIDTTYIYQRGRFYTKSIEVAPGTHEGEIKLLAPGIHQATVVKIQGEYMNLSGNFEESDELLIL